MPNKDIKRKSDLMELLNALEYQTMELAAIRQAAKDFITLKENKELYTDTDKIQQNLAYQNLKELVS